jgi:hypothetical protein
MSPPSLHDRVFNGSLEMLVIALVPERSHCLPDACAGLCYPEHQVRRIALDFERVMVDIKHIGSI